MFDWLNTVKTGIKAIDDVKQGLRIKDSFCPGICAQN
jgi:hypothetical protein